MKAAVINRYGTPEELQIATIDKPIAHPGEVLLKVIAVGINPVDTKVRAGTSAMAKQLQLPAVLGWDVCGSIEAVAENVVGFAEKDIVFGCIGFPGAGGAYAEFTVADPALLIKKPATVSAEEAAAVPMVSLTAYQAIHEHLKLSSGQTILIQAAAGGVGHLAVQFAKLLGAHVNGTASAKNAAFLTSLGVDQVIDYKNERFEERVEKLDAVLDAMGGEILYRSISCVKRGGTVVCLPSSTKDDPKAIALAKQYGVKLIWPMMHPDGEQLQLIADLLQQKKLKVIIDKIFDLDEIVLAHKAVESHRSDGKVVVRIN